MSNALAGAIDHSLPPDRIDGPEALSPRDIEPTKDAIALSASSNFSARALTPLSRKSSMPYLSKVRVSRSVPPPEGLPQPWLIQQQRGIEERKVGLDGNEKRR